MELLKLENVSRIFNTRLGLKQCVALKNIDLSVEKGEFVAIMGPSGSGKTTLLNIIASLDAPTTGDVYLNGLRFRDIKDKALSQFRRDNLGFVFQDFNLLDSFSVRDNILLPLVLSRMPLAVMESRLMPVAERLGLAELLDKYPHEISGGEKQRTAVARAVITEPQLILADEPTGALDSKASNNLLARFTEFNDLGHTILMVTHSAMAASYANRVIFIRDGELFSEIYKSCAPAGAQLGGADRGAFIERISASLTVLEQGGALVG